MKQPSKTHSHKPSPTLDWRACRAVERTPGKVSGDWVFRSTRVPVRALFENLRDGASIDDFLDWFPGVQRNQVETVLDFELATLTTPSAE
jgi:uncharacterized protein (DUF433 family)